MTKPNYKTNDITFFDRDVRNNLSEHLEDIQSMMTAFDHVLRVLYIETGCRYCRDNSVCVKNRCNDYCPWYAPYFEEEDL